MFILQYHIICYLSAQASPSMESNGPSSLTDDEPSYEKDESEYINRTLKQDNDIFGIKSVDVTTSDACQISVSSESGSTCINAVGRSVSFPVKNSFTSHEVPRLPVTNLIDTGWIILDDNVSNYVGLGEHNSDGE